MNEETKKAMDDFILESIQKGLGMADPSGEAFLPYMNTLSNAQESFTSVLAVDDLQEALSTASDILNSKEGTTKFYSITWNEFLTIDGKRTDSLTFEIGSSETDEPALVLTQPYEFKSNSTSATAIGKPILIENVPNRLFDNSESNDKVGPFDSKDWEQLLRAPTMVFFLVSAADGEIDRKETLAFIEILNTHNNVQSNVMRAVLAASAENTQALIEEYIQQPLNIFGELMNVKTIVDSALPENEAKRFFNDLMIIGKKIAKSSGGFLGLGSKIGKEEENSLEIIRLLLEEGLLSEG